MTICRVEKNKNFTVMANYHFNDSSLSLKAVGLMSKVLSLPDSWDFTIRGLSKICKEGPGSISAALRELEAAGYLERKQTRGRRGRIADMEYIFYEKPKARPDDATSDGTEPHTVSPHTGFPYMDKPDVDNPYMENTAQINTNQNKYCKETNTYLLSIHQSISREEMVDVTDFFRINKETIMENIEYDRLAGRYGKSTIDGVVSIIYGAIRSKSKSIRINGDDCPADDVKNRLLELNTFHIEFVLDSMNAVTNEIKNVRAYMLTSLYNAPDTMDIDYMNRVNHDLYGGCASRPQDCQVDSPKDYEVPSWHFDEYIEECDDNHIEEYDDEDIDKYI